MNFQTFTEQTIQLTKVMSVSHTPAEQALLIETAYKEMEDLSELSSDDLEELWPTWSKAIVAVCTGDDQEVARIEKQADDHLKICKAIETGEGATRYPSWDENKTAVQVKKRNYWTLGAGLVVGGVLGCVAGPVGMAVGYGIAKAGEIGSREQYVELEN
ncbi:hypothetical protein N8478_00830 [bacterium]|nr:hypothetical protein [bacterium]